MKELAHEKKERKRIEAWGKNLDMILGDALEEVRFSRLFGLSGMKERN